MFSTCICLRQKSFLFLGWSLFLPYRNPPNFLVIPVLYIKKNPHEKNLFCSPEWLQIKICTHTVQHMHMFAAKIIFHTYTNTVQHLPMFLANVSIFHTNRHKHTVQLLYMFVAKISFSTHSKQCSALANFWSENQFFPHIAHTVQHLPMF